MSRHVCVCVDGCSIVQLPNPLNRHLTARPTSAPIAITGRCRTCCRSWKYRHGGSEQPGLFPIEAAPRTNTLLLPHDLSRLHGSWAGQTGSAQHHDNRNKLRGFRVAPGFNKPTPASLIESPPHRSVRGQSRPRSCPVLGKLYARRAQHGLQLVAACCCAWIAGDEQTKHRPRVLAVE